MLCQQSWQAGLSLNGIQLSSCLTAMSPDKASKEPTWLGGPDDPFCNVMHHLHEPDLLLAELLDMHLFQKGWWPRAVQPNPLQVTAAAYRASTEGAAEQAATAQ